MIRYLAALLCLQLSAAALAEEVAVRASAVPLQAEQPERREVGRLRFLAGFRLQAGHEGFGGFSDIEITADGATLRSVSDRGWFMVLPLVHDAGGRLTGVGPADLGRLLGTDGNPLEAKTIADAEAMARLPDGSLLIAFERINRILRYAPGLDPTRERPKRIPVASGFAKLPKNGGIEVLAALSGDRMLAIAEDGADGSGGHSAWLRQSGEWSSIRLSVEGSFAPTAAAALPSGDLLLLERRFSFVGGFAARLSIVSNEDIVPNGRMQRRFLADIAPPLTVDNFEGVTARLGPGGTTLIYLLSDDNTNPLQWTLLMQFQLTEE